MAGVSPRALGFRMPAEWERHEATWLAWPHEETDWPGKFEPVPWIYGEIVRRLARVEKVRILASNEDVRESARVVLAKCGALTDNVEFFVTPTDRSWTRDFCPIFVKRDGEIAATDWIFNGWAKYDNWQNDNAVPGWIAERLGLQHFEPGLVLEGGSIEVNGAGALLTTEECLLSPIQARNPGCTREEIEGAFSEFLGIDRVLWLQNGIAGDDTHGHIDDLARFVSRDTIITVVEQDVANPTQFWRLPDRDSANAGAGRVRRSTAASELRELLHREPNRAGADV
jgi:agmatine deiminase